MLKQLLLSILFLVCICTNTFACTCSTPSSFCESISSSEGEFSADVLIRGKLSFDGDNRMTIKVKETLIGVVDKNEISLTYGFCDLYTHLLEDGSQYLFALNETSDGYQQLSCAISYLKIENEKLIGSISPGIDELHFKELYTLSGCGLDALFFLLQLQVYPNPTSDILKIKNTSVKNSFENLDLRIMDITGKVVLTYKNIDGILPDEDWVIYINDLSNGIYIVNFYNDFQSVSKKIIKAS